MQQPKTVTGSKTITYTIRPGAKCPLLLAATGIPGAKLSAKLTDTFGESTTKVKAQPNFLLVACASTEGQYKIEITPPAKSGFYTIASMDCPTRLARAQLAAQKKRGTVSLAHLLAK